MSTTTATYEVVHVGADLTGTEPHYHWVCNTCGEQATNEYSTWEEADDDHQIHDCVQGVPI